MISIYLLIFLMNFKFMNDKTPNSSKIHPKISGKGPDQDIANDEQKTDRQRKVALKDFLIYDEDLQSENNNPEQYEKIANEEERKNVTARGATELAQTKRQNQWQRKRRLPHEEPINLEDF